MSFMSTAPRPQIMPSASSPPKGSTDQSAAIAGTTSRCPCTSRASADGSVPSSRAKTLARPGADSSSVGVSPTSSISPATYSAARRSPRASPLPKLDVSIRMRLRQISTVSPSGDEAAGAGTGVGWESVMGSFLVPGGQRVAVSRPG
jgi:hypothetical protein